MVNNFNNKISYEKDVQPHLTEIFDMVSSGKKNIDIQKKFGINNSTFYRWNKDNEEFRTILKEGKEYYVESLSNAAESTIMKAIKGYTFTDKVIKESDKNGMEVIQKTYKKAGDSKLAFDFLKSTKPEIYDVSKNKLNDVSIRLAEQKIVNESKSDDIVQEIAKTVMEFKNDNENDEEEIDPEDFEDDEDEE